MTALFVPRPSVIVRSIDAFVTAGRRDVLSIAVFRSAILCSRFGFQMGRLIPSVKEGPKQAS
jgi:hypothetical protein